MKYIRTKDERILKVFCENVPLLKENDGLTYYGKNTIDFETSCWFPKNEVVNQADTIEKLCDGFIGVHDKEWFRKNRVATKGINYFQKPFELEYGIYKKDFANLKLKNQNGWEYTAIEWQRDKHNFIFGYIETDKGLIYVAKMNEKGELELL